MVVTKLGSLLAALALLRLSAAQAMNYSNYNSCINSSIWGNGYNATGSVSVPGPRPNDSYPAATWTWSRYVEDVVDEILNNSLTWQSLGLKTSPLQNLSDAQSDPYTGCVIAVAQLNSSLVKDASKDDGTCSSVFSADCLAEIKSTIHNGASTYSGTSAGSADGLNCNQLLNQVSLNTSSKCDPHLFTEYIGTQFLPNNFTGYPYPVCPITNPGDSNVTDGHRSFFSWGSSIGSQAPDNYTIYDQVVTSTLPVFVATWLKSTSNTSTSAVLESGGGWADTQIMCIPANETRPGSRNLTEAESTQNGVVGRANGMSVGMFGVAASTVLFGLVF